MILEYNPSQSYCNELEINDIGHFAIRGTVEETMFDFYIITKTVLGYTTIMTYGPIVPDLVLLPDNVSCNITRLEFKESKIMRILQSYINDYKKKITKVEIISHDEAYNNCRNIVDYMEKFDDISQL